MRPILHLCEPVLQFGQAHLTIDELHQDGRHIGVQTAQFYLDTVGFSRQATIDCTERVVSHRNRGLVLAVIIRWQLELQGREIPEVNLTPRGGVSSSALFHRAEPLTWLSLAPEVVMNTSPRGSEVLPHFVLSTGPIPSTRMSHQRRDR